MEFRRSSVPEPPISNCLFDEHLIWIVSLIARIDLCLAATTQHAFLFSFVVYHRFGYLDILSQRLSTIFCILIVVLHVLLSQFRNSTIASILHGVSYLWQPFAMIRRAFPPFPITIFPSIPSNHNHLLSLPVYYCLKRALVSPHFPCSLAGQTEREIAASREGADYNF